VDSPVDLTERLSRLESQLASLASLVERRVNTAEAFERHCCSQFDGIMHWLTFLIKEHSDNSRSIAKNLLGGVDYLQDIIWLLERSRPKTLQWKLNAEKLIATDSTDHMHPRGTINDNTRHPRFVRACEKIIQRSCIKHLDLGCAGGGLVWDFTMRGHQSVGIEGSDISLKEQRAAWRLIPDRLFTADIRKKYRFTDIDKEEIQFDIVTAWEVFEHIDTELVDDVLSHIADNLRQGGHLVASISKVDDRDLSSNISWHKTIKDENWWHNRLRQNGFVIDSIGWEIGDFVRGVGNPRADDWNVNTNPSEGFHVVAKKVGP